MPPKDHLFFCTECGNETFRWVGQCPACHTWNSLKEAPKPTPAKISSKVSSLAVRHNTSLSNKPIRISQIEDSKEARIKTHMSEFDRVLGGGLVAGSVVLIGGDPGVGKSTLLGQIMANLSKQYKVLYISGEESQQQIAQRCRRLKLDSQNLLIYSETDINSILQTLLEVKPQIIVIDSIQTIHDTATKSASGSVTQVRDCCAAIVNYSKQHQCTAFIIGHVTKEGSIAGPRILEHMVDTVLYFEGQQTSRFRLLRVFKNRFGAVNELAVFAMLEEGLKQMANPSALFLANRSKDQPGNIIMPTCEGSRAILLEIQALAVSNVSGYGKRLAIGFDSNRLSLLIAILNHHTGIQCLDKDIYLNLVGGIRVTETAADLAVILAIVSSINNRVIASQTVAFGEVGLNGEIRPAPSGEARLIEAQKQGFNQAIIPNTNISAKNSTLKNLKNLKISAVGHLKEAIQCLSK